MNGYDEFERVWDLIHSGLEFEVGGSPYTKDEIWELITSGRVQLWALANSAVLTLTIQYPRHKNLLLWVISGKLKEIVRLKPLVEQWAKDNDYSHIIGQGRKGWDGVAKREGYEFSHVVYKKAL